MKVPRQVYRGVLSVIVILYSTCPSLLHVTSSSFAHPVTAGDGNHHKMRQCNFEAAAILGQHIERSDLAPGVSPFPYSHGLNGKGELIAITDGPGLDLGHELLYDPAYTSRDNTTWLPGPHRKVHAVLSACTYDLELSCTTTESYHNPGSVPSVTTHDVIGGHATHVSASALGSGDAKSRFNGTANGARLVFYGMGSSGSNHSLTPPKELGSHMLQPIYDTGARIISNSWDSPFSHMYDTRAYAIDAFLWQHPDVVMIFPAGNIHYPASGEASQPEPGDEAISKGASPTPSEEEDAGSHPIYSPMTAKHILSVGSSETTHAGLVYGLPFLDLHPRLEAFNARQRAAQFQVSSLQECCERDPLLWFQETGDCCPARVYDAYTQSPAHGMESLAFFSAYGSSNDGRRRPDVVAPGDVVVSARAHDGDPAAVQAMQGTSMSAPLVAGCAAIIRQYLREGYYPTGRPRRADALPSPSSCLVRAMLIHSGSVMGGYYTRRHPSRHISRFGPLPLSTPNSYVGHGLVSLQRILYLACDDDDNDGSGDGACDEQDDPLPMSPLYMLLNDTSLTVPPRPAISPWACTPVLVTGATTTTTTTRATADTLRATLVYLDPPGHPEHAGSQLVVDLDLFLMSSTGDIIAYGGETPERPDTVNTVEQVTIPVHEGSRYSVCVQGHFQNDVPPGIEPSQPIDIPYALVITLYRDDPQQSQRVQPRPRDTDTRQDPSTGPSNATVVGVVAVIVLVLLTIALLGYRRASAWRQRHSRGQGFERVDADEVPPDLFRDEEME